MSGFWRGFRSECGSARLQRWVVLPFCAALEFYVAMVDPTPWRWLWLALGVFYTSVAGWLWSNRARQRDMQRRNAIVIDGAQPADVQRAAEFIEWLVEQRQVKRG